jgi:hypothetical protein
MYLQKKILFITFFPIILISLLLSDITVVGTTKTAYFLNAPMSGIHYQCDNSGVLKTTAADGSLTYDNTCANITFSLNNKVILGIISVSKIPSDYKLFITDFVGSADNNLTIDGITHSIDTNNHYVGNVARLLQSLDSDETPQNGLSIFTNNITYATTITANTTASVLEAIVKQQYPTRALLSELCAIVHLEEVLKDAKYYVDTVAPCKPKLAYDVIATSNDKTYIELIGERNSSIYVNGFDTQLRLNQDGRYYDFELNTTIQRDSFDNFNISYKDNHTIPHTSDALLLSIFNDTDQPFIENLPTNNTITITHPATTVYPFSVADDTINRDIPISFEILGTHANYFSIRQSGIREGILTFNSPSVVGTYNITVKAIDKANHYDIIDLTIIVN